MPVQYALISQFAAFTVLYLADSRATQHGWTPPWYGTYRFVLTAIVGGAIFISLVGRAKIGDEGPRMSTSRMEAAMHKRGRVEEPYTQKWERLETKDKEQAKKDKEEEKEQAKKDKDEEQKGAKDYKQGGTEEKRRRSILKRATTGWTTPSRTTPSRTRRRRNSAESELGRFFFAG